MTLRKGDAMKTVIVTCMITASVCIASCGESAHKDALREALTLHASFDSTVEADFALGESVLYTRTSWKDPPTEGFDTEKIVIEDQSGKFGGAVRFDPVLPDGHRVFFHTLDNVAYSESSWGGTVSYWLNLNPNTDLPRNFCDPFQFMGRRFNDAAIWQDFTDDKPRDFRIGMFPDGPENINTKDIPEEKQPVFRLKNPDFKRGEWHHVVVTWDNINSGRADAVCMVYIDGKKIDGISERLTRFTWDPDRAQINIGANYVGLMDDFTIFNRTLTEEEVIYLHGLENGVSDIR